MEVCLRRKKEIKKEDSPTFGNMKEISLIIFHILNIPGHIYASPSWVFMTQSECQMVSASEAAHV